MKSFCWWMSAALVAAWMPAAHGADPATAAAAAETAAEAADKAEQREFDQRARRREEAKAMSEWAKTEMENWSPKATSIGDFTTEAEALMSLLGGLGDRELREPLKRPGGLAGLRSVLPTPGSSESTTPPTGSLVPGSGAPVDEPRESRAALLRRHAAVASSQASSDAGGETPKSRSQLLRPSGSKRPWIVNPSTAPQQNEENP